MDSSARGTYDELKLDPGVPARRKRSSGCKCVSIIMLTSIGSLVALFCGINLVNMYRLKQEPHASLLYKTKSGDIVDPAAVIRPLIDEKQTFDIVATVWLRTNDDSSSGSADVSTLPVEKAIFTGKVFQGLTLKDKGIHTTVNYTVPTEILYVTFFLLFLQYSSSLTFLLARTTISKTTTYEPPLSSYRLHLLFSITSPITRVGETKESLFLHSDPGRMYYPIF